MYVSTLTSEIMDSMVAVEGAVEGALERQTTFRASLHWRKKTAVYQRYAFTVPFVLTVAGVPVICPMPSSALQQPCARLGRSPTLHRHLI